MNHHAVIKVSDFNEERESLLEAIETLKKELQASNEDVVFYKN